jgi:hypothetical protein
LDRNLRAVKKKDQGLITQYCQAMYVVSGKIALASAILSCLEVFVSITSLLYMLSRAIEPINNERRQCNDSISAVHLCRDDTSKDYVTKTASLL